MENMGTGIARMKNAAREAKVAEPEFEFSGFFKATFKRNVQSLDPGDGRAMASDGQAMASDGRAMASDGQAMTSDGRATGAKDRKRAILSCIEEHGKINASGAAALLGLSKVRVRAILREMTSEGAIEKIGNTRYACYMSKRSR